MLETLYIENVAVIEKAEISFAGRFNILTGETGAGKSIIIDSLCLLLGQRASRDMIRTGADRAYVSAVFSVAGQELLDFLQSHELAPDEDGNLLIERSFRADGHGFAKINGRPASITLLKELSEYLVVIHGQHMNQQIMNPCTHIGYVDAFGDYADILNDYKALYKEVSESRKELLRLKKVADGKAERQDVLLFRVDELSKANLKNGEEEELSERRNAAAHAEKISGALETAMNCLSGRDDCAYDLLLQARNELERVGQFSSALKECANALSATLDVLDEQNTKLRDVQSGMNYEPGELDRIELRLNQIKRIKAKYGGSVSAALSELSNAQAELAQLDLSDENLNRQEEVFQALASQLAKKAEQLTRARIDCGEKLSQAIMEKLSYLDMSKCQFCVSVTPSEKYTASGHDVVEFFISANPGEAPKPLAKIASGGELSRIMLSIVHVLSERDMLPTMIFDEVDAGVSGKTAQKIGVLLKNVSKQAQVLCITHLAQIAAMANHHLLVTKDVSDYHTQTRVIPLDREGQRREIARIIGGINITQSTLDTADELIAEGNF